MVKSRSKGLRFDIRLGSIEPNAPLFLSMMEQSLCPQTVNFSAKTHIRLLHISLLWKEFELTREVSCKTWVAAHRCDLNAIELMRH